MLSLVQTLAVYFFVLCIIRINVSFVLSKQRKNRRLYFKKILKQLTTLITILLLGKLSQLVFHGQLISSFIVNLTSTSYLILLYVTAFKIILTALHMRTSHEKKKLNVHFIIHGLIFIVFLGVILKNLSGAYETVVFLTLNIVQLLIVIACIIECLYFLWFLNHILATPSHPFSIAIHKRMGLPSSKKLIEFSMLYFLLTLFCIRIFFIITAKIWNISPDEANAGLAYLRDNVYIFNVKINIPGIARGLVSFCFILILGRLIGIVLTKKNSPNTQTQFTIITLTNYAAFILGTITLLLTAGVNLSGFAMVASALSVGIGFGLKNFAADLIAGLILLFSKPLRPGDNIKIEDTEGFIQKINLLSTIIKTPQESDIIVPNGALLSRSVINYTYANKFLGITSGIMIQDPADVKRTKNILLNVAKSHPELHQRGNKKPFVTVNLNLEKTSNITLTLYCTIKDVNKQLHIKSSIDSDIIEALRKHKITLKT
jgi:potassium-dependent mechanosensitive channel